MRMASPRMATALLLAGAVAAPVAAFVGFVTVAPRQSQRATVYNSADLTLVRDTRAVVFSQGVNALRFSWANTLIDPTSFVLFPPDGVKQMGTQYILDEKDTLSWKLDATRQTAGALGIQYFMAGVTWRADHALELREGGTASLKTHITIANGSGEELEDTQFRLVVGQVRLTEHIRTIAARFHADVVTYTRKTVIDFEDDAIEGQLEKPEGEYLAERKGGRNKEEPVKKSAQERPKEVTRESLSELHIFAIAGTETVPNGGARSMVAFEQAGIAVKDVYRCVSPSGLIAAQRVVSFMNDAANKLGTQPLPEGKLRVFRAQGPALAFEGAGEFPYTPMGERNETPLGTTPGVTCEAHVKKVGRTAVKKDALGRITGWTQHQDLALDLVNGGARAVRFEVRQHFEAPFDVDLPGAVKEDVNTVLIAQDVAAFGRKALRYRVTTRKGTLVQ